MHVIEVFEVIVMFRVLFLRMSQKLIALVLKLCLLIMKGLMLIGIWIERCKLFRINICRIYMIVDLFKNFIGRFKKKEINIQKNIIINIKI